MGHEIGHINRDLFWISFKSWGLILKIDIFAEDENRRPTQVIIA